MTPDLYDQWTRDRLDARQRQAESRRLARARREPSQPWQAKAGLWLIGAGMALMARAPRARPERAAAPCPATQR